MYKLTTIHPFAFGFTVLMSVVLLLVPRRYSIVPFLLVGVLVTEMQRVVVLGFDFTMLRLLLVAALVRIVLRCEYKELNRSPIDTAILIFAIFEACANMALRGTTAAVVNALGSAYNTLGIYFFLRCMLRDIDDVRATLHAFAVMAVCLAAAMIVEQRTGRNMFSIFGGVPAITEIREGKLRSQGAFPHPLLAGAFGSTLLPVFYWVFRHGRRWVGALGLIAAAAITVTSYSSGPVLAFLASACGLACWSIRGHMRKIRWGFLLALLGLSLVMKAPVYALVARVAVFGSSTGYHRYALIDQAFKRYGEWWLLGTKSTAHWGVGLWDVTNQYVAVAVHGGAFLLIVFVAMIALGFRNAGRGVRSGASPCVRYLLWTLGSALFAHVVAFMGMTYFGAQIYVNWFFVLGVLALAPRLSFAPSSSGGESLPEQAATGSPRREAESRTKEMRAWLV